MLQILSLPPTRRESSRIAFEQVLCRTERGRKFRALARTTPPHDFAPLVQELLKVGA
jgi:hypothetical protein